MNEFNIVIVILVIFGILIGLSSWYSFNAISEVKKDLKKQITSNLPEFQSGEWSKLCWPVDSTATECSFINKVKDEGGSKRVLEEYVTFPKRFSNVPVVNVSLTSIDTTDSTEFRGNPGSGGVRYTISASDVTQVSFKLTIETWHRSTIYKTKVNWFAYTIPSPKQEDDDDDT